MTTDLSTAPSPSVIPSTTRPASAPAKPPTYRPLHGSPASTESLPPAETPSCTACSAYADAGLEPCGCAPRRPGQHRRPRHGSGKPAVESAACGGGQPVGPVDSECWRRWGSRLVHALHARSQLTDLPVLAAQPLLRLVVAVAERASSAEGITVSPQQALVLVVSQLNELGSYGDYTAATVQKMAREAALLTAYLAALQVSDVRQATLSMVTGWVHSQSSGNGNKLRAPSVATQHLRRSSARLYFRLLRGLHVLDFDPTLDLDLPARSGLKTRPLGSDEMLLLRAEADAGLADTRTPAVLAITEAGGTYQERPRVIPEHVDLDTGRVWLTGGKGSVPRWVWLTEWGWKALRRRVDMHNASKRGPQDSLLYGGEEGVDSESARVSCDSVLVDLLKRTGLGFEPDVRPRSIELALAQRVYDATGKLELAMRAIGATSADRVMQLLGIDVATPSAVADKQLVKVLRPEQSGKVLQAPQLQPDVGKPVLSQDGGLSAAATTPKPNRVRAVSARQLAKARVAK